MIEEEVLKKVGVENKVINFQQRRRLEVFCEKGVLKIT